MTTNGATMRLLENYQEAIQTKDDAKRFANQQLASMNDEQRATFIKIILNIPISLMKKLWKI